MLSKANITWSVKQVVKMISKGTVSFENSVQRGYVWNKSRQSLLIHSLIVGFPVPPCFARKGDGVYDMLDGKQRLTTLQRFYNNEFALTGLPMITVQEDGEEVLIDLNGCKYEDLPNDIKDELDSTSLTIYYFDGITEEEVAEMFFRLNNGAAMNSAILTRVKALSKEAIKELGQHNVFKFALSTKAKENYTNEDMVIKAAYLLSGHDNLETKNIQEWISENKIDTKLQNKIYCALSRLETIVTTLNQEEENKKIVKKILTKTHFLSLLPILDKANEDKVKDAELVAWVSKFYAPEDKCSTSYKYNEACGSGSAKKEAVTTRYSELEKSYNKSFISA